MDKLIDLASKHSEAFKEGNSKKANKLNDKILKGFSELSIESQLKVWEELIVSEDVGVKMIGATQLLKHNPDKGLYILENIANGDSIHASVAPMTIDMFKNGLLNF